MTLVLCYQQYDETWTTQYVLNAVVRKTLIEFRQNIKCSSVVFDQYVSIYVPRPRSQIVIHSKVYVFDNSKLVYNTVNICDRSFSDHCDIEMGFIIKRISEVRLIYSQLQDQLYKSIHLFYKFVEFEDMYPLDIQVIQGLVDTVSWLVHEDVAHIAGLKANLSDTLDANGSNNQPL